MPSSSLIHNDVTRGSIACSLTLRHVAENCYVKYPVHNSWRYESVVLTNRIAGNRMNIKKIKLFKDEERMKTSLIEEKLKQFEQPIFGFFQRWQFEVE